MKDNLKNNKLDDSNLEKVSGGFENCDVIPKYRELPHLTEYAPGKTLYRYGDLLYEYVVTKEEGQQVWVVPKGGGPEEGPYRKSEFRDSPC